MNNKNPVIPHHPARRHLASSLLTLCVGLAAGTSHAGVLGESGVACQKTYEHHWVGTLSYAWFNCSGFKNELGNNRFYWNLEGRKPFLEATDDERALETVDIFYGMTHGGTTENAALWAMWDDNVTATSWNMFLGNEDQGLSIFSTYSCRTMTLNNIIGRYARMFRGGLRYATGSHGLVSDGELTDEVGEDYADNLKDGDPIRYAWRDGLSDWWADQDVAVFTKGRDAQECSSRRRGMKWTNYRNYPRRDHNQPGYYCWNWWTNI